VVGRVNVAYEVMQLPAEPGLTPVVCTTGAGTPSQDALSLLATWAATQDQDAEPSSPVPASVSPSPNACAPGGRAVGPEPTPCWLSAGPAPARVSFAAGAGGPVGGDQPSLDVVVRPGATPILRAVAATVVLPGPHGRPSCSPVTVRVSDGGTLVWLPVPAIAADAVLLRRRLDTGLAALVSAGVSSDRKPPTGRPARPGIP
jgi:hypothetical protein